MGLTCISMVVSEAENLLRGLLPFVLHRWRNICSSPLPIFNWVVFIFVTEMESFFMYSE